MLRNFVVFACVSGSLVNYVILEDNEGYNIIVVFINRLSKKAVSLPYRKTTTIKDLVELYTVYYYYYIGLPDSVVSDRSA